VNVSLRAPQIAALLAALALAPVPAAAADSPSGRAPGFRVSPAEIVAGPSLTWEARFLIDNTQPIGAYVDSMACLMEDQDPGETHASRRQVQWIPAVVLATRSVSAGETSEFMYSAPAVFEKGQLTFTLFGHLGDGTHYTVSAGATVSPGPVSAEHPSTLIDVGGKKVECVFFASLRQGGAPGLLLVHGDGSNARRGLSTALSLASRGYSVMLVSLPGYGTSEGPADLSGPHTVAALGAALDRLKSSPGVDSTHVGAWGDDRGAGAVALLASQRRDLSAVVAQSGIYDLWAVYRGTRSSALKQAILDEAGRDSSAWRARSPSTRAGSIHAPLLLLHAEDDETVPVDQARGFAAAVTAAGTPVETRFPTRGGHSISSGETYRDIFAFLTRQLGR
jgi:dienelactone hydrolase